MKTVIIVTIFLIIFGTVGTYIYIRITQAFEGTFVSSIPILIFYVFLILSFLFGKILEIFSINFFSNALVKIGSVSLGFFLYAFLIIIFIDIIRLINFIVPFYPNFITANIQKTKFIVGIISFSIIFIIFIAGYINAHTPKVKDLDITINKIKTDFDTLNIVAVSDIHLGSIVNKTKTKRLINTINKLKPDLVIIAGDMIDDNINVVKHYKLLEYFKELNPKYGVYACPGNHEYISKAYKEYDYFEQNGIRIIKDTTILIDNKFYIIGRDDIEGKRINKKERKSLQELTKDIDFNLPVVLLDHQPYKLEETAKYAIDLQFSGHTHGGQMLPFNFITRAIFEKDWGYLKKKNTHFYISSGFGTAVVPIRLASSSEIVNIKLF